MEVVGNLITGGFTPVGYVVSEWHSTEQIQCTEKPAVIQVFEDYLPALHRVAEHSHCWILSWFHKADRSILRTRPTRINVDLPEYGVFGLRNPARPNPIGLTLVQLEKIEGGKLHVSGLDAIDGTPILDIKPYFEGDIVFSPRTPYIFSPNVDMRRAIFRKQALAHHGEACPALEWGVNMALLADQYFGQIQSPELKIVVKKDACLADVLQGLTRARLANPARFSYIEHSEITETFWRKGVDSIKMLPLPTQGIRVIGDITGCMFEKEYFTDSHN